MLKVSKLRRLYVKNTKDIFYTLAEGILISVRSLQRSEGDVLRSLERSEGDVRDPTKYIYLRSASLDESI